MHPIIKTAVLCLALVLVPIVDVWWFGSITGFSILATCGLLALLWMRFILWYTGRKERDEALLRRANATLLMNRHKRLNEQGEVATAALLFLVGLVVLIFVIACMATAAGPVPIKPDDPPTWQTFGAGLLTIALFARKRRA